MSLSHSVPSKAIPIPCKYTSTEDLSRPAYSFTDIYFNGTNEPPVRYQKLPVEAANEKKGTYGKVNQFTLVTPVPEVHKLFAGKVLSHAIPLRLAGKEFDMDEQVDAEVIAESKHTSLAMGWCANNIDQEPSSKVMMFQPYIKDKLFSELRFYRDNELLEACIKVLEAIKLFHEQGHIHCDIKETNIFVGKIAKLIDCGLSRFVNENTQELMAVEYMAPECRHKKVPATAELDIYSVGWMFMFALSSGWQVKFTLNPYLEKRFKKLAFDMMSDDPKERPSLEKLILLFKNLASHACYLSDDKKVADLKTFQAIADLSTLLEFDIEISAKKRASYIRLLGDKELDKLFQQSGKYKDSRLVNFLKEEDPTKVINSMDTLGAIMAYYPSHTLSNLLKKIGVNHIKSLIRNRHDLDKLNDWLSIETSIAPYKAFALFEYLQLCEGMLRDLDKIHAEAGGCLSLRGGQLHPAEPSDPRTTMRFVKHDIDNVFAEKNLEFKVAPEDEKNRQSHMLRLAGHRLSRLFGKWKSFSNSSFPSVEISYSRLCAKLIEQDPAKQITQDQATFEAVKMATWGYFLCNQDVLYRKKHPPEKLKDWRALLPTSLQDMNELLNLTLDFNPIARYYFLRLLSVEHINKIMVEQRVSKTMNRDQAIDSVSRLWCYLKSDCALDRYVHNTGDLEYFLKLYPMELRLRLMGKIDLNYLRDKIIKNKPDLDTILLLLPQEARQNFEKEFVFKKPDLAVKPLLVHGLYSQQASAQGVKSAPAAMKVALYKQ